MTQDKGDIERGLQVDPIDELLASLDATQEAWAKYAALYGPGGLFDNQRKIMLSIIMLKVRDEIKDGERVTDALVDARAHAHPDYVAFIKRHTERRAEWLQLDAERDAIVLRINRGQALLRVAGRMAG